MNLANHIWIIMICLMPLRGLYAQGNDNDGEIVFHVIKSRPCVAEDPRKQNDLTRAGLKGRVKTIVTEEYNKGKTMDLIWSSTTEYDTTGTMISTIVEKSTYSSVRKRTFSRDHQIVSDIETGQSNGRRKRDYQYDKSGRLIAMREYGYRLGDAPSHIGLSRYYFSFWTRFDTVGRCIYEENYKGNTSFYYDSLGRCVRSILKQAKKSVATTTYEYGSNCTISKSTTTGRYPNTTEYIYDEHDSLIMERIDMSGQISLSDTSSLKIKTVKYEYDAKGNKTDIRSIGPGKAYEVHEWYKYTYDTSDNWVKKEFSEMFKSGYYIREITYY